MTKYGLSHAVPWAALSRTSSLDLAIITNVTSSIDSVHGDSCLLSLSICGHCY